MPFSSRRTFISQCLSLALGASILPLSGCESLAVDPVSDGTDDFPFLTPNESFFTQFGADGSLAEWAGIQQIPRNTWRLAIDGAVATPLSLQFADLDADASVQQTILATLRCILDNNAVPGLIGTAAWTGVPLSLFLARAGIDLQTARRLRIYGADGFTNNLKLETVFPTGQSSWHEPLLVFAMNGKPLRPEHGAPVRLIVPGQYGYKSIKWIERIEVTESDEVFGTYQEKLGYTDAGVIDVNCKSTSVLRGARLKTGTVRLAGFALSGFAPIETIRYSVDGGAFENARLVSLKELASSHEILKTTAQVLDTTLAFPYKGVWAKWEAFWDATPGEHSIHIEAIDASGNKQPLTDPDPTNGQNPVLELQVLVE